MTGTRVRGNIRKRPLDDFIQSRLVAGGQRYAKAPSFELHLKPGSRTKLTRMHANRRDEALFVPDRRPQIENQIPYASQNMFDEGDGFFQLAANLSQVVLFQIDGNDLRVQLKDDQVMSD